MNFYHNLITTKSWQILLDLKKRYKFILIGGWAVYLYTRALKSKDIDLVMEFEELEKIKNELGVSKNERLRKYEARIEEAEIDIYVPFYSNPGIPAEELKNLATMIEGFKVSIKEALAFLKQKALLDRKDSLKGRKDLADLISLFRLPDFDWQRYRQLALDFQLEDSLKEVAQIVKKTAKIEEIGLNSHQMARLKAKILPKLE